MAHVLGTEVLASDDLDEGFEASFGFLDTMVPVPVAKKPQVFV
jgi:hypothetical protein